MSKDTLRGRLPKPERTVHFPDRRNGSTFNWKSWWEDRVGEDNLVAVLGYGSQVTGDASATSIHDFIVIVNDPLALHRRLIETDPSAYAHPRRARWHALLNEGPSYYHTKIERDGEEPLELKYLTISLDNFVRGCNGSLPRKDRDERGGFGLSVAGRMQKAALDPIYWPGDEAASEKLARAINKARIDGVWLALGSLGPTFSTTDLLEQYVSLSYRGDVRIEKPGKAQTIIDQSRQDYEDMGNDLLERFQAQQIVSRDGDVWEKNQSPTPGELRRRMRGFKAGALLRNYGKNSLTFGVKEGFSYAKAKIRRARNR